MAIQSNYRDQLHWFLMTERYSAYSIPYNAFHEKAVVEIWFMRGGFRLEKDTQLISIPDSMKIGIQYKYWLINVNRNRKVVIEYL